MAPAEAARLAGTRATPRFGLHEGIPERAVLPRGLRLESRRLLATSFQASWLGQTANTDLTGPDAGVGPDGYVDDQIQLTAANTSLAIQSVQIRVSGGPNPRWESAPDLDGYSNAEVIDVSGASGKTYNLFFNPFDVSGQNSLKTEKGQQLAVNVYYSGPGERNNQPTSSRYRSDPATPRKRHHADGA